MFQLALRVQLQKNDPNGSEEYSGPLLCHKQEVALQASEINNTNKTIPNILEQLEK